MEYGCWKHERKTACGRSQCKGYDISFVVGHGMLAILLTVVVFARARVNFPARGGALGAKRANRFIARVTAFMLVFIKVPTKQS